MRDELPPPVVPGTGQKTHGRWIGPDGQAHELVSGKGEYYDESEQAFRELDAPGRMLRASDVEMKLAAHMRAKGIPSATLIINNVPCGGMYGCDNLAPVLLPPGATLTVHGSDDFTKTYQGGAKPPWRR
jgi:Double-stranded DNA deaminase toxin A